MRLLIFLMSGGVGNNVNGNVTPYIIDYNNLSDNILLIYREMNMLWNLISILGISFGLAYCGLVLRDDIKQLCIKLKRNQWHDLCDLNDWCYDCGKPLDNQMFLCDKSKTC